MENKLSELSDRELMVMSYDFAMTIQQKSNELNQLQQQAQIIQDEFEKRVVEEKQKIINLKNTENASTTISADNQ